MRRCLMLVAAAVACASAAPAYGAAPDGAGPWADFVVSFNQGLTAHPTGPVPPARSDPTAALGPAESPPGDNSPIPLGTFVSLGFGGSLTLGFENPICNGSGVDLDIDVLEITQEPYPPETAQVYVSEDGVTFFFAGTVSQDGSVAMPASITVANFVRLVDISDPDDYIGRPNPADGFDVDGVMARNTTCPTGKLEICKSSANGMYSRTFQYSLNGGSPISVRGGRCTGAITTRPGLNTIVELPTVPPTDIQSIAVRPTNRLISQDLDARTVQVKVVSGSTAATETKVTFTNEPGGGATGDLKICKVTNTPALLGVMFSFRVNGGPLISTEAGPEAVPALWSCRPAGTFQTGTIVTVQEQVPGGTEVDYIDTDPADRLRTFNLITGTMTLEIGGGQNIVIYDNEAIPPAQSGYIEVCKDAALIGPGFTPDPEVTGLFTFTVAPPEGPAFDVSTYAGQCTEPLQVAAGVVRVTEHARPGFRVVDIFTDPDTALLFDNLINGWADVEVPVSDSPNFESQVHFVNARDRTQLKLCKALAAGSGDLAGQTFTFDVTDLDAPVPVATDVSVIAPGCKTVGDYPVGHRIDVQEDDAGPYVVTTGEGVYTMQAGINTVTITNTAMGLLRVCKTALTGVPSQPTFRFRIDMGAFFAVTGGTCQVRFVAVGNHTVTESVEADYELDPNAAGGGITVTPPGREVSRDLGSRTVTVSVPFGPSGETRVDFANRVRQGFIVICKSRVSTPVRDYAFDVYVDGQGVPFTVSGIAPGECSEPSGPFPVLRATDGQRTQVEVFEQPGAGYQVTNITCSNCRPSSNSPPAPATNPDFALGYIRFSLAPGTNTVTYTNGPA